MTNEKKESLEIANKSPEKKQSIWEVVKSLKSKAVEIISDIKKSGSQKAEWLAEKENETVDEETRDQLKSLESSAEKSRQELDEELEIILLQEQKPDKAEYTEKLEISFESLKEVLASEDLEVENRTEVIKDRLIEVMKNMHEISKLFKLKEDEDIYNSVLTVYRDTLRIKRQAPEEISQAFSEIFYEFSDLIDNEVVTSYIDFVTKTESRVNFEKVTQVVYGRTDKELETIKKHNRENAARKIRDFAEQPYISQEMLLELHKTNNRSIVPNYISALRKEKQEVTFGVRFGAFPEDVQKEIDDLILNTNNLIDQRALGLNKKLYEIEVAKLHNELLDIHPFIDRNGSTSLLFVELMMAREDYKPSEKREKNYYKTLTKALNNNGVAIGIIGYEHYKIKYQPGVHEVSQPDPKKKIMYDLITKKLKLRAAKHKEDIKKQKKAKKAEKKEKMQKAA
jgi:fido (protein-threonine AMPylation protein)